MVIGITGTNGAGKGTIVDYLINQKGFVHYSVRAYLNERLTEKGLEINRTNMVNTANELRAEHYPSYIIEQLFEQASLAGDNCIIESLRTPGEVLALKEKGDFTLLAVDADPKTRYKRIKERGSATDQVSFEEFVSSEMAEMASEDPNKQNLSKCMKMADHVLENSGSVDQLHFRIEEILHELTQSH